YLDSGVTRDGMSFLAMEWLDGVDLKQALRRAPLLLGDALRLAHRIAEGLGAAHALGMVHRDVKPANIFLPGANPGEAKLLDFGIARWSDARSAITVKGGALGTPAYMSPEQVRGNQPVDARSDVFALGAVLFECLAGKPVFSASDPMA